jgi:hypothetical protein
MQREVGHSPPQNQLAVPGRLQARGLRGWTIAKARGLGQCRLWIMRGGGRTQSQGFSLSRLHRLAPVWYMAPLSKVSAGQRRIAMGSRAGRRRACPGRRRATATWRSGDAADCKSVNAGSIPAVASKFAPVAARAKECPQKRRPGGEEGASPHQGFLLRAPPRDGVRLFRGSSAVEQPAVNRLVVGSNPTRGAICSKRWIIEHLRRFHEGGGGPRMMC